MEFPTTLELPTATGPVVGPLPNPMDCVRRSKKFWRWNSMLNPDLREWFPRSFATVTPPECVRRMFPKNRVLPSVRYSLMPYWPKSRFSNCSAYEDE